MYILELYQNEAGFIEVGLFDTIEQGREFISMLDGYRYVEEDGFEYESILLDTIPEYMELEFNGNVVPFTRFMFTGAGDIEIFWKEIPNLSAHGDGMVPACTRVDAYHIENEDLKDYIAKREENYRTAKALLESKGYEVSRGMFGSEDGEAILYRKGESGDWHFLTHMDPWFCEAGDIEAYLDDMEIEL